MPTSTAGNWNNSRQSGLTLLELGLVLSILGIFAGFVLPRLPQPQQTQLARQARQLELLGRHLWQEAVLTGKQHRLYIDLEAGSYKAQRLDANGVWQNLTNRRSQGEFTADVQLSQACYQYRNCRSQGQITCLFSADGWAQNWQLQLQRQNQSIALDMVPLTGNFAWHKNQWPLEAHEPPR